MSRDRDRNGERRQGAFGLGHFGIKESAGVGGFGMDSPFGMTALVDDGGPPPTLGLTVYGVSTTVQTQTITIQGQ